MNRIAVTDGSGRWFDESKAEKFAESKDWNGSNHISVATGSQWEHEALYRTAGGQWVLNHWSQAGGRESYRTISDKEAARWMVQNGHDSALLAEQIAALEIE